MNFAETICTKLMQRSIVEMSLIEETLSTFELHFLKI